MCVCVLCVCACCACTTVHVCMCYTKVELFIIDQDQVINEATEAFCEALKKLELCQNMNSTFQL